LFRKSHETLKKEADSNACISLSLSTISFTATDCTLHAESPVFIFFRRTGESSNHTSLSRTLLACCALTSAISIVLGFWIAWSIAVFVISWNTILGVVLTSSFS
jgi:ABC-type spermidine/putrescine transport system permease subunit I